MYYNDPLNLGQFAPPVDLIDPDTADPYMFIAGELNKEGNPEVYIVRDSQDTYLINTGNDPGTGFAIFTELTVQNSTNTASFGGNIRLVDWDNDGFFEPVVATFDAEDEFVCPAMNPVRRLAALRNLGNTPNVTLEDPLDPATRFWNTFDTHDIVVFDIDGDELLDMWSGTCTGNNVFMGVATGACCLPDGSCAILTQIECDAQCGTYQGDNIPCLVQCVEQATEACCFPDNTCQNLTLCQCAQQGGASKGAGTTCADPDICVPTGACCLPNFGGCIVVSEEDCLNLCGDYKGDGTSCNFLRCPRRIVKKEIESGTESPPQSPPAAPSVDLGACCFDDGTCTEISECNCDNQGGTYSGDGTTCAGVVCFGGQCCILGPPFTCTDDVLEDDCLADCGVWTDLFTCSQVACPSFVGGACCLEDVCVDGASQSWCECQGGVYRGDFTECSCITTCGPPNGACCLQSGQCVENTADECDSLCGSFNGEGSLCSGIILCPIIVPIFGACCLLDGTCASTSRCNCESQGGLWQGDFTDCAETTCPAVCGGIQGIPCLNVNEFCKFGEGECCCDFKGFCTPIPEACILLLDPVCGCDGITYGNACLADMAQVTVLHAGECTGSCCLPEEVCVDGLTENECTCQCGEYGGNNNLCAAPTCVPPVEACCFLDAPCADLVPCECLEQGGTLPGGGFGICANLPPNTCPVCANASTKGCWKELTDAEVTSVNMILLKTGKVMVQHRSGATPGINQKYQIFDPATEQFSPSPPAQATIPYNMYCAAFDQLGADGRVLFAGGRSGEDTRISAIYDPDLDEQGLNAWSAQDDMAALRFYPTTITLSHRENIVLEGQPDTVESNTPEIFELSQSPQWDQLTDAAYNNATYPFNLAGSRFPILHVISTGRVIYTGSTITNPATDFTRILDPVFENWTQPFAGPDPLVGLSGCMYELDQIMKLGPSATYTLAATLPGAQWEQKGSLTHSRFSLFVTLLPDGKILAVGSVLTPELYDPDAGTWSEMNPASNVRSDHSSMVLLPDGRVLTGGPTFSIEVYSPGYYFNLDGTLADRPEITSVSSLAGVDVVQYGETFQLVSPDAAEIDTIRLMRMGASTHTWNMGQQSMKLAFSLSPITGALTVTAPQHQFQAPPGYVLLFVVVNGVPSNAAIVKLQI